MRILDRQTRERITVVERLSPTNQRPGHHRGQYLARRAARLNGPTPLVEIDHSESSAPTTSPPHPSTGNDATWANGRLDRAAEEP